MKIEAYSCDRCNKVITDTDGYIVSGNITFLNGGGLVGNNIAEDGTIARENHYCIKCLKDILDCV